MIILNSGDARASIDSLPGFNGVVVPLRSYDAVEVLKAYLYAIELALPPRPTLVAPGHLEVIPSHVDERGKVTDYVANYDAGGDKENEARLELWKDDFEAWKALCEPIRAIAQAMIAKGLEA